jgi:hypothetical protein
VPSGPIVDNTQSREAMIHLRYRGVILVATLRIAASPGAP